MSECCSFSLSGSALACDKRLDCQAMMIKQEGVNSNKPSQSLSHTSMRDCRSWTIYVFNQVRTSRLFFEPMISRKTTQRLKSLLIVSIEGFLQTSCELRFCRPTNGISSSLADVMYSLSQPPHDEIEIDVVKEENLNYEKRRCARVD